MLSKREKNFIGKIVRFFLMILSQGELQYIVASKRKNTIFCSPKKSLKKLKKNLKNIEKMLDLILCL